MSRRYCTIPALFNLRDWFEKKFGDLCAHHDWLYVEKFGTRVEADRQFREGMKTRGYPLLANVTYYGFLRPFGWLYWNDIIK